MSRIQDQGFGAEIARRLEAQAVQSIPASKPVLRVRLITDTPMERSEAA